MTTPVLWQERQDKLQRRKLLLPRGDLHLADGRMLRRIIGYDLRETPGVNATTRESILESRGWEHRESKLIVSAGVENTERWGPLLHVSMSYPEYDPPWKDIKMVRDLFFPRDMDCAMILPREADYVNVHRHCFHIWQIPSYWGLL